MNIFHAGGKIDNFTYTNSKEAIIFNIENSYKKNVNNIINIELDVIKINDAFVIAHNACEKSIYNYNDNFDNISYNDYKKLKSYKKYTVMDFYILKELMEKYIDVNFILDIKPRNDDYNNCLIYIRNILGKVLCEKIIIQVYYSYNISQIINNQYENVLFATYNLICENKKINDEEIINIINQIKNKKLFLFGISVHIKDLYTDEFKEFKNIFNKENIFLHGQNEKDENIIYNNIKTDNLKLFCHKCLNYIDNIEIY